MTCLRYCTVSQRQKAIIMKHYFQFCSFTGRASQVELLVKNPPAGTGDIRDMGLIPGSRRFPGGGHGDPLQYSCLENPHEQRSLTGSSSQHHKESDMTKVNQHSIYTGKGDLHFSLSTVELRNGLELGETGFITPDPSVTQISYRSPGLRFLISKMKGLEDLSRFF